jgi:hypothetical protein
MGIISHASVIKEYPDVMVIAFLSIYTTINKEEASSTGSRL